MEDIPTNKVFYSSTLQENPTFEEPVSNNLVYDPSKKLEEEFCYSCQNWAYHQHTVIPNSHKSCICFLFAKQSICCNQGYHNLLTSIPYLAIYVLTPMYFTSYFMNNDSYPRSMHHSDILDLIRTSQEEKLLAISILKNRILPHQIHLT